MSIAAKQISWQEGGRNRGSQRRGSLELSKPKEGYVADNRHPKGGYTVFFFKGFFFQPGAAFLAICCILELKICVLHAF
jgi:hypothetical protein